VPWPERLGNLAAMLIHFLLGGVLLFLLLANPVGIRLLQFPDQPRWQFLANPLSGVRDAVHLRWTVLPVPPIAAPQLATVAHPQAASHRAGDERHDFAADAFSRAALQFALLALPALWLLATTRKDSRMP
jgi:hypothetical protein